MTHGTNLVPPAENLDNFLVVVDRQVHELGSTRRQPTNLHQPLQSFSVQACFTHINTSVESTKGSGFSPSLWIVIIIVDLISRAQCHSPQRCQSGERSLWTRFDPIPLGNSVHVIISEGWTGAWSEPGHDGDDEHMEGDILGW